MSFNYFYMEEAIKLAKIAYDNREVPIGAVVVCQKTQAIIARSYNMVEAKHNPLKHAEIEVIESALLLTQKKFLIDCDLYVTLEPCSMCWGAIGLARVARVFFGAYANYDNKGFLQQNNNVGVYNHHPEVYSGIMEQESSLILSSFFAAKRSNDSNL